jgi:hypothetical protein
MSVPSNFMFSGLSGDRLNGKVKADGMDTPHVVDAQEDESRETAGRRRVLSFGKDGVDGVDVEEQDKAREWSALGLGAAFGESAREGEEQKVDFVQWYVGGSTRSRKI